MIKNTLFRVCVAVAKAAIFGSAKKNIDIATNQSLNQEVPMFLHRGFRFKE